MSATDLSSPLDLCAVGKRASPLLLHGETTSPVSPWGISTNRLYSHPVETETSTALPPQSADESYQEEPHDDNDATETKSITVEAEYTENALNQEGATSVETESQWTAVPKTNPARLFVGGLDANITRSDLEAEFGRFGTLREVWMAQRPPGFAFIEFEDLDSDAADRIVHVMNGTILKGILLRVERARDKNARRGAQMRAVMSGAMRQITAAAAAAMAAGGLPAAAAPGFTTFAQQLAGQPLMRADDPRQALINAFSGVPAVIGGATPGYCLSYPRPMLHGGWGDASLQTLNGLSCITHPTTGMTFFQPVIQAPYYGFVPDYTSTAFQFQRPAASTPLLTPQGTFAVPPSSGLGSNGSTANTQESADAIAQNEHTTTVSMEYN